MLLDEDNRVEIGIVDMTPAKDSAVPREVFDAPWLVFADKDGPPIQDGTIMAGGAVKLRRVFMLRWFSILANVAPGYHAVWIRQRGSWDL